MAPAALPAFADLAPRYDAVICDVWGVLHDGRSAHASAGIALAAYREAGGKVLLLSNAPRPAASVARDLETLDVRRDCYDAILTSGDAAREAVAAAQAQGGLKLYLIGTERHHQVFEGLGVTLAGPEEATLILCAALFHDDTETPEDYHELLARLAARGLPMLCANPDLKVERGPRLVWCAGALAEIYATRGGVVTYLGKPHAPVYAASFAMLEGLLGRKAEKERVLAVGDGLKTDIAGANRAGIDALLITAGLHAAEFGADPLAPEPDRVRAVLARGGLSAIGFQPRLRW
jgi:HAD superfamily hydrolase (TIGR01459 family)